ncbi:DUF2270 domain-containing protein [Kallotenue papyrolyticum]|uniref:DUF2270 domain-containing protein n=1 Tax=Kallotenue papyrolyticum TaxID=1325125 RepID=UPI0004786178|nr:DUF2270 domain-containing protein [Kallotenue papyrolyticum]
MQQRSSASPLTPGVMVHFYRGLMDQANIWRARIDTTTNWAIVTSGSIASFVLADRNRPHVLALIGMFLAFAFLAIEARRFRFYDLWSGWIRLMETEYFAPILRANTVEASAAWHTILMCDLQDPHFKISFAEALGRRLRHNYFAIFAFLLLLWLYKLLPPARPEAEQCRTLLQCAAIGPVPGLVTLGLVALAYAVLVSLMVFTPKLRGTGTEILDRRRLMQRMVAPNAALVGFKRHPDLPYLLDGAARPPEED